MAAGLVPCAVVATTGTTSTTALDPLAAVAEVARRHALWLHVDAAMAGTAMVCPELRWMWAGVEAADSVVFNPHKWMGVGVDCTAYFVRDVGHLLSVMSTHPSYLRTPADAEVKNFRDWGIPLGRRFRALKVWFVLQSLGADGLRAAIRRDVALAQAWPRRWTPRRRGSAVRPSPCRRCACVTGCLRPARRRRMPTTWPLAEAVNATGEAYVTPAVVKGRRLIRISIGALDTAQPDVDAVWALLQRCAADVAR